MNNMRVLLAPMEGVLDSLVRELLTEVNDYDLCITEFLRVVDQLLPVKSFYRLSGTASQQPDAVRHPRARTAAGQSAVAGGKRARAVELGSWGVDLNCGCPSKLVNGSGGGQRCSKIPSLSIAARKRCAKRFPSICR
jgi:tRNA-dihydrouridine synthase C